MLDSFGNDGAITSTSTPQAFNMLLDIKAEFQTVKYPSPGHMLEASAVDSAEGKLCVQLAMMHDLSEIKVDCLCNQ